MLERTVVPSSYDTPVFFFFILFCCRPSSFSSCAYGTPDPRPLLPGPACTQRRKELDKEAIRAKRGAYQAYDDEEFEGEIGPGAKRKVRTGVLVQA